MALQTNLPAARGVSVETTSDGKTTGVFFKVDQEPGYVGAAMPSEHLSRLVAMLLNRAAEVAEKVTPGNPPEQMTTTPIMVSHMGVSRGRSDSEAIVAFHVGNLDLSFAVDLSILRQTCTDVLSMTKVTEPRPTS